MASPILAFRPATVVDRVRARSEACPLSTRELLPSAVDLGLVLPLLSAPVAAVARGALVAARELDAALGLGLPPGVPPEPWFQAVTTAADEVAAGLPLFLAAEVVLGGEGATQVERAIQETWRLVGAGITHVAVDVAAVAPEERGRIAAEVARPAAEHGLCVEVVVPLADGSQVGARAAALFEELARRGVPADVASVRCPPPADDGEARLQAVVLARLCQALSGAPVLRRGPLTAAVLERLRGSPVRACEDGGGAAARALALLPVELVQAPVEGEETRANPLERVVAELSDDAAERLEATAYVDAIELLERLGARGSAASITRALRQRLEER